MNVEKEVAAMERMTVDQLRSKYAEVFQEPTRSRHKQYLIKRIAWRMQANAEGGLSERALRRAMELIVPPHVLNRPKLGFPVPIRHWLKDEMYGWARGIITESQADALVDKDAVLRLLDAHRAGPHDYSRKVWTLLVALVWHGIFVEGRIRPEVPETVYPVRL